MAKLRSKKKIVKKLSKKKSTQLISTQLNSNEAQFQFAV
jgi:hypothetical protein